MPRQKSKRRADGQYEYKGTVGRDLHGNAIRKSFYSSKSKADAKKKFEAYKLQHEIVKKIGVPDTDAHNSFSDWAIEWLETYKRPVVSPTSYESTYKTEVERLIAFFGDTDLADVRPIDVQRFFNTHQHFSESRLKKARFILNAIFEAAIDNDLCTKNPAKRAVMKSTYKKKPRRALSDAEIDEYITLAAHERDDGLFLLLTGIRRGELLGLMWSDYDQAKQELCIQRSMQREDGMLIARPPKWNSFRTLPLSAEAVAVLDRQPRTSLYIFPNKLGEAQDPRTWSQKYKRFSATLPERLQVTPHELRHTYGTKLKRDGVDIYTIQKLLGHKSVDITTEIYVHAETDALRKAVDKAKNYDKTTTPKSV